MRAHLTIANVLVCVVAVAAQPLGVAPDQRNAALRYWAAWAQMDGTLKERVTAVPWKEIDNRSGREAMPKAFLDAEDAVPPLLVDKLLAASSLPRCDFEVEYEQGPGALLPHLGPARLSSRVLRIVARSKLLEGDLDGAAARIAAIYGLAHHLANDRVHISGFLAVAMAKEAADELAALVATGPLTAAARATLFAALDRFDAADPFRMKAAFAGTRVMTAGWTAATFNGPDAGSRFLAVWKDYGLDVSPIRPALEELDGEGLARQVARLRDYFDDVEAAWGLADAESVGELERLSDVGTKLQYGALTAMMGSEPAKDKKADMEGRAALKRARETISAVK